MKRTALRQVRVGLMGAGLIGQVHAHAYESLNTLHQQAPADIRLVVVADKNESLAREVADQFGFERTASSWDAVVEADDVDVVSVALPNYMHRSAVEALVASGKHVLCEKPLSPTAADSWAMLQAARRAGVVHCMGFNLRRVPAIAAIKRALERGDFGEPRQFTGHYLSSHAVDKDIPLSWRYTQDLSGGGAIADTGPHIIDIARFLLGDIESVHGSIMATFIEKRPIPAEHLIGHDKGIVTGELGPVENDDVSSFMARFRNGTVGQFTLSRVATGYSFMTVELGLIGSRASATFESDRASEFEYFQASTDNEMSGFKRVITGPAHPYVKDVLVLPVPGVGLGLTETWVGQAYDFVSAVVQSTPLASGGFEDGYAADLVREAVRLSAERGSVVSIDEISTQIQANELR